MRSLFFFAWLALPLNLVAQSILLDFDGDGISDPVGLENQRDGSSNELVFSYRLSSTLAITRTEFGSAEETPVVGDYDGDGMSDLAVAGLPGDGSLQWRFKLSSQGGTVSTSSFGVSGDLVMAGCDFDGDGKSDRSVIRSTSVFAEFSSDLSVHEVLLGSSYDNHSCGDIDGDDNDEIIVQKTDASTAISTFSIFEPSSGALYSSVEFGTNVNSIFAADIDGDGIQELGYERNRGVRKSLVFRTGETSLTYNVNSFKKVTFGRFTSGSPETSLLKQRRIGYVQLYQDMTTPVRSLVELNDSTTLIPRIQVSTVGPLQSSESVCQQHHDPYDGNEGFLWKPVSDSNGKAVVLFPRGLRAKRVRFIKSGGLIESPYSGGNGNGGRDHFRSRLRATSFPELFTVTAKFQGITHCWLIDEPLSRID